MATHTSKIAIYTYLGKRALEILRKDGPLKLARQSKSFLWRNLYINAYFKPKMRLKYGAKRPIPKEILVIDPTHIDYRISNGYVPHDHPCGIIRGDWDLKKSHWKNGKVYHNIDNRIFYGLIQRFEQEKEWEETVYYQTGMEFLESGESFPPLSYSQTIPDFRRYLRHLDNLYEDIKEKGYDMSAVITAHIGRDGELMVIKGQHRLTLARIADVKKVPVRIKYRHKNWEELRMDIYKNGFSDGYSEELRDHPDLQNILS